MHLQIYCDFCKKKILHKFIEPLHRKNNKNKKCTFSTADNLKKISISFFLYDFL